MSADIKELRELIEREKAAEEKVARAKEEAETILKRAREKAGTIVHETEADPSWDKLKQESTDRIARKKAEIKEEHDRTVSVLETTAQANAEKAVKRVIEEVLKVGL